MPGLLRGMARTAVISGTATAVSNRVSRRQAGRWAAQDARYYPQRRIYPPQTEIPLPRQAAPPPPPPPPPPTPPAPASTIDQLKELAELRQQGILTDDEFAAQKARVLAG